MVPDGVQQDQVEQSRFGGGVERLERGPEITEIR